MSKKLVFLIVAAIALLGLGGLWATAPQTKAADAGLTVQMSATATESLVTYNITLVNGGSTPINDVYVAATIPSGGTFDSVSATPAGATSLGAAGNIVSWVSSGVAANSQQGPFTYKVKGDMTLGSASAWVRWTKPSEGAATSAPVTQSEAIAASSPRRGCLACHVGNYTLAHEAEIRVKARNPNDEHPHLDANATVETCLTCHAPGKGDREGKGVAAPWSLRDIVHPAHMYSAAFKDRYNGGCFTCHNVRGDGTFELLGKKVDVSIKGIPNSAPIPGAIPPSEGKK